VTALLAGCVGEDVAPDEDGENDAFPNGKSDGGIDPDSVEALGVLALVNESWIDADLLVAEARIGRRAATNIFARRDGADGRFGTPDDNLFDTLAELDAIAYVGPATLDRLVSYAKDHGFVKRWSARANMSAERSYHSAVSVDGLIYAIGSGTAANNAEVYTPSTNSWAPIAQMATPRYAGGVTVGADGLIYVIGGYDMTSARAYLASVEAYEPRTNTWKTLAPMPARRALLTAVTGPDGRIYAIGGYDEGRGTLRTVEVYTPSTNAWAPAANMPSARYTLAAALGDNGKIYAFGGTYNNEDLATAEEFDPATNRWTSLPKMSSPRSGHAAIASKDGRIYLLGGDDDRSIHPAAGVATFKASTKEWSGVQGMILGRTHLGAAEGADGKIYVVGGYEPIDNASATVEAYTPE